MKYLPILFLLACTDNDGARRALDDAGFTDVELNGWSAWGCDKHDDFATTNPRGKRVEGAVCCGILKNCTIRFR